MWLRYCATSWKVASWIPLTYFLLPLYDPEFGSVCKINEYHGSSLRGKGGRCVKLTPFSPSCTDFLKILGASTPWSTRNLPWPVEKWLCLTSTPPVCHREKFIYIIVRISKVKVTL
jgi:hypothetical protein